MPDRPGFMARAVVIAALVAALTLSAVFVAGCGSRSGTPPAGAPAQDGEHGPAEPEPADPGSPSTPAAAGTPEASKADAGRQPGGKPEGESQAGAGVRPTEPVALDWPEPSPREKWVACPVTRWPCDPVNTIVAIVVENSAAARPQSGLSQADVVYEVLAEGGITRLLALYHCGAPKVVGPVRSVRPYFAVIAKEWGAAIAHCGGDPKDVEPVRTLGLVDVDELRDGRGFWRDRSRRMPHNLYVSANNVRSRAAEAAAAASTTVPTTVAEPWGIVDWDRSPARGLDIRYGKTYEVSYRLARGIYERFVNGSPHTDRETGKRLTASNVIVQFAGHRVAYADLGLEIALTGRGKATYLLGGRVSEGYWEKKDDASPTRFFTAAGERIAVARGQTWIQVVPEDAVVTEVR